MGPLRTAGAWVAAAVVLGACTAPPSRDASETGAPEAPRAFKRIHAAILSDPPYIYNALSPANAAGSDAIEDLVHDGLTVLDNRGERRPRLAEAIPSIENGLWKVLDDGRMETTWRIRRDVRWHDGAPLAPEDLAFTAQVLGDREMAVLYAATPYSLIEAVEVVDLATVVVRWKRPYIEADTLFESPLPRHVLVRAYGENKATFEQLPYFVDEFVGLGPYRLREWTRGSSVVLAANDHYVLGRPRVDEVVVKFFLDANTLVASLLADAVQVTLGRGLSLEQAITLREQWSAGRVENAPANEIRVWPQLINPSPSVASSVPFRRAMLHAIDRQQMVDALEAGLSTVAHAWVQPSDPEYADLQRAIVRYEFDPRRAMQLIEGLGYARGTDGLYGDAQGQRLSVEIRANETNAILPRAMLSVADYWQRIGVGVEPVIIPRQQAQDRRYRATFPAFELVRGASDLSAFGILHSSQTRRPDNSYSGSNSPGYMSPEFDALVEQWQTTIPRRDRLQVIGQMIRRITDEVVVLGLFYDIEPTAIAKPVQGMTARARGGTTQAWNAHEWDVP